MAKGDHILERLKVNGVMAFRPVVARPQHRFRAIDGHSFRGVRDKKKPRWGVGALEPELLIAFQVGLAYAWSCTVIATSSGIKEPGIVSMIFRILNYRRSIQWDRRTVSYKPNPLH